MDNDNKNELGKRREIYLDIQQQQHQEQNRHKGQNGQYNQKEIVESVEDLQQKILIQQKQIQPEIIIIESGGQDDYVNDDDDDDGGGVQMTDMMDSLNQVEAPNLEQSAQLERVDRNVVLDWLRQEYENEGFRRALTAQDEMGLLKQAGFSSRQIDKSIPGPNFESFCKKFKEALGLLRLVSFYWNEENPYIIAGFDCDKGRAEGALKTLPPGTFVIRMSFGDFGKLVISVVNGNGNIENGNRFVHYSISGKDFGNKSLGQLVMSLKTAEMLLDVFCLKLVEKSKVFVQGSVRST